MSTPPSGRIRNRKSQANVDCGLRFSRTRNNATLSAYAPTSTVRTVVQGIAPAISPAVIRSHCVGEAEISQLQASGSARHTQIPNPNSQLPTPNPDPESQVPNPKSRIPI